MNANTNTANTSTATANAANESKCPFLNKVMPYYIRANHCMNEVKPYVSMVIKAFWIYVNTITVFIQGTNIKEQIDNNVRKFKHVLIVLGAIFILRYLHKQ